MNAVVDSQVTRDFELLGPPRLAVEAAVRDGWDKYLREDDVFIGMNSFGASAPGEDVYRHFGITTEAVVNAVISLFQSESKRKPA